MGAALERYVLAELPSLAATYVRALEKYGRRGAFFGAVNRLIKAPHRLTRSAAGYAAGFARRAVQAGEILIGGGSAEDALMHAPESSYLFGGQPRGNRALYTSVVRFPGAAAGEDIFHTIECLAAAALSLTELLACIVSDIDEDSPSEQDQYVGGGIEIVSVSHVVRRY